MAIPFRMIRASSRRTTLCLPSGDAEADVVYANYGSPEDFNKLKQLKVDVRGKIVLVRYGQNFRGVKAFVAQEHGAAGVHYLFRSDRRWLFSRRSNIRKVRGVPQAAYSAGRSDYMFEFPGDPTTPGIAPRHLPDSKRVSPAEFASAAEDSDHAALLRAMPADSGEPRVGPIRLASGKERCHSPITLARGRRK